MKNIITIEGLTGSGHKELGVRIANRLGYEYYDHEIISLMTEELNVSEDYLNGVIDRRPPLYIPIATNETVSFDDFQIQEDRIKIFGCMCSVVKRIAEQSDCVIIGHCADQILKDFKPFKIFVYADNEFRQALYRCCHKQSDDLSVNDIKKALFNTDKEKSGYYEYFTGKNWADMENYDLYLNITATSDIDEMIDNIVRLFNLES